MRGISVLMVLLAPFACVVCRAEEPKLPSAPPLRGGLRFTDVTESCGVAEATEGRTWDVAIGDVDGDGTNDLYCMAHAQGRKARESVLFASSGRLALKNITEEAFAKVTATGGGQGAMFCDLDGDGRLDLITGSNDGVGCVFRNEGGTFAWHENFPGHKGRLHARELSAGDVDGDGDIDLVAGVYRTDMLLFENDGKGRFTKGNLRVKGQRAASCTFPVLADMDGDGDLDIVSQRMSAWQKEFPYPRTVDLWVNDGNGTFTWESDRRGLAGGTEGGALLVGDFDNDADLDVVQLLRTKNGGSRYFANDGKGRFTERSAESGLKGADPRYTNWWTKATTGDFNNDGDLDICFGGNVVYMNDGSGRFKREALDVKHSGLIVAAGDLDGDGDLDLAGVLSKHDGYFVHRNDTDNSAWLVVRVDAGKRNPTGTGAKVSVLAGDRLIGYRQIINASAMQQTLDAHFGLGRRDSVRVVVTFPDGARRILTKVEPGRAVTVKQPGIGD